MMEMEAHDSLREAITPLQEMLEIPPPESDEGLADTVRSMPRSVHELAVRCLRYGVRETMAITKSHYDNANLDAISRGFPEVYDDEQLDVFEREASPPAEVLARSLKNDDDFPCKPLGDDNVDV